MRWILGCALLAGLGVGYLFLPEGDRGRLAAIEVYRMLTEESVESPTGSVLLGRSVMVGPAQVDLGGGRERLSLGRTHVVLKGAGPVASAADRHLRDALIRGFLKVSVDAGRGLEIAGLDRPVGGGLDVDLLVGEDDLTLTWGCDGAKGMDFTGSWTPARRDSVLPPLVAIVLAIALRQAVLALFAGVLVAALILRLAGGAGPLSAAAVGLLDVFTRFFRDELLRTDRAQVIGFVVAMLAMVGVITRNGGIRGLMNQVAALARTVRSTQVATYLMGLAVFFDDYANTILVGSMMRPLSDRFRIAREKLAYIIDSTAAPVAGLSIFSTWIAFEVSTFSAQLPLAGLDPGDGYAIFIETLPYRFYCIFTLLFVGLVTVTGRDFGPMRRAEMRARSTGRLVREGGRPMVADMATAMEPAPGLVPRARQALLPLVTFIAVTLFELLDSGRAFAMPAAELFTAAGISTVLGNADSYRALLVGSTSGLVLAVLVSLVAGLRGEIAGAAWRTLRSTGIAIVILYLAWMIGAACIALGTAQYLTVLLGDRFDPLLLPVLLFLLSSAVSFSTGSSWGTMSILLPLVVGLAFAMGESSPDITGRFLMVLSIGAVLEGSIFGDHCSPISDTTVLSSVASASDHIDHVRTQAPYALLTMAVAVFAGYVPVAFLGWSSWLSLGLGVAVFVVILCVLGRRVAPAGA